MQMIVVIKDKVESANDSLVAPCKLALLYPQLGVAFYKIFATVIMPTHQ